LTQLGELMPELAERFSQFRDGSNKAALAAALLGEEAGPRLIPLLNRGREAIEAWSRAAGTSVTPEAVQRVRDYQQATGQLQIAFEALSREIVTSVAPALTAIAQAMTHVLRSIREPSDQIATVATIIQTTQNEIARLNERFQRGHVEVGRYNLELQRLEERLAIARSRMTELQVGPFQTTVIPNRPDAPRMDPHALERAQLALDRIMERLSGQRDIFDSINFSWQEHERVVTQAVEAIGRAHETQHRREHALHQLNLQMRRQEQQAMLSTATLAASTIQALWPKQKGAAIGAAIINTAVGVTRALAELPPPWSWAQAALIAASGAAQIATIRSTNETGSSGTGTAPPAADATPGRALTIQGVDPGHMFSGGAVRRLIELINDEVADGATLISTGNLGA
jgi:hypothetical protein